MYIFLWLVAEVCRMHQVHLCIGGKLLPSLETSM